ncbi:MAG: glutathione peroxidase [Candidatus Cloacimonetes bacterium]|nr:glutathione peroxidase [Candidatus Cloacimonadota bacterium]MCB5287127.1 glutathione peroxidase [Candidatus Cloacimonadota bacterium]MCK9183948.1 glutathione peroxidase [Candidatus Cloacimonadota bacterium]MCK9584570.1 glutathione peroxidase [Candidatus Cloacimonadota bacterium]
MISAKSIYDIKITKMDGTEQKLEAYRGKVVLIVNTASKCGFTKQYEDLQNLWQQHKKDDFVILGFPANNFMNQEPGTNEDIVEFCQINYGVDFPMFEKISVKGKDIHPLYDYLTSKKSNPEFGGKISWNFNKFLISKDGKIIARFSTQTNPMSSEIQEAIKSALK